MEKTRLVISGVVLVAEAQGGRNVIEAVVFVWKGSASGWHACSCLCWLWSTNTSWLLSFPLRFQAKELCWRVTGGATEELRGSGQGYLQSLKYCVFRSKWDLILFQTPVSCWPCLPLEKTRHKPRHVQQAILNIKVLSPEQQWKMKIAFPCFSVREFNFSVRTRWWLMLFRKMDGLGGNIRRLSQLWCLFLSKI